MKRMVLETLGPWQTDPSQPPTPPALPNTALPPPLVQGSQPVVYLVDKPGLTQSAVAMGEVRTCSCFVSVCVFVDVCVLRQKVVWSTVSTGA